MIPLLLIDDDRRLAPLLTAYAEREGYALAWAASPTGARAWLAANPPPALILLDVMLPGEDGFAFCRALRAAHDDTPVIMLTARGDHPDRVLGLQTGADDYVPKPFDPPELFARVAAVLRRRPPVATGALDPDRQTVRLGGREVPLTTTEYRVLAALAENAGRILTRDRLLEAAGDDAYANVDRAIDQHVSRLRAKLEPDPKHPRHLHTVRGRGYRFTW